MLSPKFAKLASLLVLGAAILLSLSSQPALAASIGTSATKFEVHERRHALPHGWIQGPRLNKRDILPIRIALTQRNIDTIGEHLMSVSHPDSRTYGKHWTAEQVAEKFAPAVDTVEEVSKWLISAGISSERLNLSISRGWLEFQATVEEAENILKTEYHAWVHEASGMLRPAIAQSSAYYLPSHIRRHIDFITPTLHFDTKVKRDEQETKAGKLSKRQLRNDIHLGAPNTGIFPKVKEVAPGYNFFNELQHCYSDITPLCLRALYKLPTLPSFLPTNPLNSFGIVEYTPQSYIGSDLDMFFSNYSKNQKQKRPTLVSIDGGVIDETDQDFGLNAESDLDLEYAMTLVNPIPVTLFQTGDPVIGASFNDFLDALDGSYCAGDDPSQDQTYPDPFAGGYKGPKNCGGAKATKVISTSYGYNEADLTTAYETRQCNEYAKLGLLGTTFVFSSGDNGVAGNYGQCIDEAQGTYTDGTYGSFNPSFPSVCPYVLSVGATQINGNNSVLQPEGACEQVIYSGGGFSNRFALPAYQSQAVKSYFANNQNNYTAAQYNNSQMTRGFPDVSANGANYVVALDGTYAHVYGTSASAPTFASVLTLINEARLNVGKSSVGFVNPALYANPAMLNDITTGNNPGCGTNGFNAVKGWDPVTGLGTPNYPLMLAYFLARP